MGHMRVRSPHTADVLCSLPLLLARELDTAEVDGLVDALVAGGWRTGQLRHRIGGEPSQGSVEGDAARVRSVLQALVGQVPPDAAHAQELEQRARSRQREGGPGPASAEVRDRAIAQIRAGLKGVPARRTPPAPRPRPSCSACDGEGSYFVTREVHLCRHCVAVLATGEVRLVPPG
ncbi:MAG: hypothetical protein AVDCRST_MAG16-409 [uncultured Frankineae bacterium]|uniref:Uncharacterized protein n=1 Tax=uncultured Frankineae bacterium TaxID=437475 RepID=A0A6J4KWR9_9ACTN|nr:MAG: hypothetical protein AVDCRST_MAG16-409 [uncultured Frankineae bacterium]